MRLDEDLRVIKYVIISGDFFAYPVRSVNDLETVLKNTPIDGNHIRERIQGFFAQREINVLGVTAEDFIEVALLAVEKAREGRNAVRAGQGGCHESCADRL